MKDRVKSRVWTLVGMNAAALIVVLLLAYGSGSRSGGLSILDFGALPQLAGFEFLAALLVVLVMSVVLLLQLGLKILKPVTALVDFSEKLMSGDYETRANVTEDDFGVMAENWNRAAELVAQAAAIKTGEELMRSDLAELEKMLNHASRGDFAARAPEAAHPFLTPVVESFNAMAENLARRMERVRTASADIAVSTNQVIAASAEMSSGTAQQEQSTVNAAAAIAQLTASTQQVSGHATAASEAARRTLELSEQGAKAVRETEEGMQRIRGAMQATTEKIKSLGDRSLQIYEIINLIHETNLLALNALMESSKGSQGGQMDVMSAEMRKLGDHSRAATRDIVKLLKSIQAESNEAVTVMDQGNRVAENGARLMEQASQAFSGIATVVRQTAEFAEAISAASAQQLRGTENVAGAVQDLAANLREDAGKSRQAAKIVEQMARSSEQLTQAVTQLRPAQGPTAVRMEKVEKPEAASAAVIGRA